MEATNTATAAEQGRTEGPLAGLGAMINEAIAFAEGLPKEYRARSFDLAFERLNRATPATTAAVAPAAEAPGAAVTPIATGGLSIVAKEIGVDPRVLARVVSIGEDGKLSILGRIDGRAKADLQVSYSVVYCYVKERALNQLDTPIAELRELCHLHSCYDTNNFTATFRKSDLLRELGEKGAHARTYRLSTKGVEEGKALLKKMVEA
jgi:hypothetical protein